MTLHYSWPHRSTVAVVGRLLVLGCLTALPTATTATEPNWAGVEPEAAELLAQAIRIDTVNPPGNESTAASFWKDRFEAEGIPAHVYEARPGRGSVYARLKGRGNKKALILLNHLDVVPARAEEWEVDPFAGVTKDGYVYGRGAIDCKGIAVAQFLAMAALKRAGVVLERDVVFLGTSDEEAGGRLGAGWFVDRHADLVADVAYLLTEGGGIRVSGKHEWYEVAVAEKAPCWVRLDASGPAGHGSRPPSETAVTRLVRALDRLRRHQTALKVVPPVSAYFAALAARQPAALARRYRDLPAALTDPGFLTSFLADPSHNALVRNTIAITVLEGSLKANIIPARASAQLDCRLLPGEDSETFLAELASVIDDPAIRITPILQAPSVASATTTPLFEAIRMVAQRSDPDTLVVPRMTTGFTDARYFRSKGIVSYGFSGLALTEADTSRVHGANERVPLRSVTRAARVISDILSTLDRLDTTEARPPN